MTWRSFVPGRIELLGKHVDYAGGASLTCAIDRGIRATMTPLEEPVLVCRDDRRGEEVRVTLDSDAHATGPMWRGYARAVVRRLQRDFPELRSGAEVDLTSDLAPSAGMSSSSALVVTLTLALAERNALPVTERWRALFAERVALAEYAGAIESGAPWGPFAGDDGVGTQGGAQDHVAMLCGEAETVGLFQYLPAHRVRAVPFPDTHALVVGVSGVRATKTAGAKKLYNRASLAVRALVHAWQDATGRTDATLAAALASSTDAPRQLAALTKTAATDEFSAAYLAARLAQFREESERIVPGAADALTARDWAAFASWVQRSQALADEALGNQVPETRHLAARAAPLGAVAASAFGAGFGGSVWALVERERAAAFRAAWQADYRRAFPRRSARAAWYITRPSAGAQWG